MFLNVIFTSWTFNTKRCSGGENKLTPHVVLICVDLCWWRWLPQKKKLKKMFVRFHFANFCFCFLNALFCKDAYHSGDAFMFNAALRMHLLQRGQFFLFLLLSSLTSGFLCFHLLQMKGTFWEMCRFSVRSVIIFIMSMYLTKENNEMLKCLVLSEQKSKSSKY